MRWLPFVLVLLCGCPAPVDSLVFELPDGTVGRELALDFGVRGGPARITALLLNRSDHPVAIGEPQLSGDAAFTATLVGQTLEPGARLVVPIELIPIGMHAATLVVASPSGTPLAQLTLAGSLDASRCALPDVVDFGAGLVGERPQRAVEFPVQPARRDVFVAAPGTPFVLVAGAPAGTASVPVGEVLRARAVLPDPGVGDYTASWKLDPGGDCAAKQLQLKGTVLARFLSASPSTVDFGVVTPPGQPAATARLFNALSRPVTVTLEVQSSAGGPSTQFRSGLTTLELPAATRDALGGWRPGETLVPLSAWLLGAGTVTGKLVVTADAQTLEVPLVARGAGAGLLVTPSPVDLGEAPEVEGQRLPVGSGVTLSNDDLRSGASDVTVSMVTVEADPGTAPAELCVGTFDDTRAVCTGVQAPLTLAPGAKASLRLRALPTGPGPWRWYVVLHTDDVQQPQLRFEVTARARVLSNCVLGHPLGLRFGPVRAPTPVVQALVLDNQGPATCVLQGLWVDGSPDVRASTTTVSLSPGERRLVDVEYLPTTAPGTSASPVLRFSVNSITAPSRAVPLEVRSDDGCLFVTPEQFDFGTVAPACGARVQRFGLGNRCTGQEVSVLGAALTGSAAFVLSGTPPPRIAQSSFEADPVSVLFDPTSAGAHTALLELEVVVVGGSRKVLVPLRGLADAAGRQRDRFVMPGAADALLLQDASPGAAELQQGLSLRAAQWLALARARRASVRLGGVRADETPGGSGTLTAVDGQRWLALDAAAAPQVATLLDVGSAMTNPVEAFAGPALAALSGPGITGPNAGFLRRGASLNVVSLSNAGEGSTQPLSVLLPQLAALKGSHRPEHLSWSAVGPFAAAAVGCTYDEASPNTLQRTLALQLGGVVAEHCEVLRDAQRFESSVAPTLFGARDALSLRTPPATGALPAVTVGGVAVPEQGANQVRNWSFDITRRSVTFTSLTLQPGDVVEFEYPTLCPP